MSNKVKKKSSFFSDFKDFITKGNVIDLAVAVIIGGAFGKIVSSLVNNIITPLTGIFLKSGDISSLKWVLTEEVPANILTGAAAIPESAITYGVFLQNILDFLVISFVIFLALRIIMNIQKRAKHKEILAAEAKAKAYDEKKKAAAILAAEEAQLKEAIKTKMASDIGDQAKLLKDIKDIMQRIEKQNTSK